MSAWDDQFPENSVFAVCLDGIKLQMAAEEIAALCRAELKKDIFKRDLLPGLRAALNVIRDTDKQSAK